MIELRASPTDGFLEEFFVRITEMIEPLAALVIPFAAVQREPLRVRFQDLVTMRHVVHAVCDAQAVGISHPQPHRPHRGITSRDTKANIESPHGKVGVHGFVDLRQRNTRHRGTTSPSSPGRYQRTPRRRKKPQTALNDPRSSKPQTFTSPSGVDVLLVRGVPKSPVLPV